MRVLFDPTRGRFVGKRWAPYSAEQTAAMRAGTPDPAAEEAKRKADATAREGNRATLLAGDTSSLFGADEVKRKTLLGG